MAANFVIRQANDADADAIGDLWMELVEYHRALDPALPAAAARGRVQYARRVLDHLDNPLARVFVAEADGQIIGYVIGMILDFMPDLFDHETSGFLSDIYVRESHRRGGVGRALVDALQDWFRSRNIDHFEWHVAARNDAGFAFWQSVGGRGLMVRMRADLNGDKS